MKKDYLIIEKGGLTRYYLKPFPLESEIPEICDLVKHPTEHLDFINHVVSNHKGLNWKIYRYKLNSCNYKSFLYAFAYRMAHINPSVSTSWQVESNARRLKNAVKRAKISLSSYENEILDTCLYFRKWHLKEADRIKTALLLQLNITSEYGLISQHPSIQSILDTSV